MKRFIGVRSIKKQGGVAALWMGLSLVPIMGFTFWAVEGTRYVQEKSRLGDAAEAAAIAVTMADQEGSANEFATKYVNAYVRDIKSSQVTAKRKYQEAIPDSDTLEFIQYTVDVKTTHDSWFSSTFIPSFNETQDLTGQSVAKKYPAYLGDNNIDIVFVADFSGSMNSSWSGGVKINDLKSAINQISAKLLCETVVENGNGVHTCKEQQQGEAVNRVGIVPYNIRTRESQNDEFATSQLRYNKHNPAISSYSFEDVEWDKWGMYTRSKIDLCSRSRWGLFCPSDIDNAQQQAKRISNVFNAGGYIDVYDYVDFGTSINDMMENKFPAYKFHFKIDDSVKLYSGYGERSNNSGRNLFWNLELTSDLGTTNKESSTVMDVYNMAANGGTASFQGMLRGIQVLAAGNPNSGDKEEQDAYENKTKMLLILSDGVESPSNDILGRLVRYGQINDDDKENGLCGQARKNIPGLYIGFIGIDYDADKISEFKACVKDPKEDIIPVSNLDELIEKIEELIRKGSKTSGTTKLY